MRPEPLQDPVQSIYSSTKAEEERRKTGMFETEAPKPDISPIKPSGTTQITREVQFLLQADSLSLINTDQAGLSLHVFDPTLVRMFV